MTSFPSGHTSESFMAGTFLALYLNAKLKPFADFHTSFWKMVAVMAPVIGAMFVAGSLVADRVSEHFRRCTSAFWLDGSKPSSTPLTDTRVFQNHHHHDILLSIPIGVTIALLAYRTHYASLLNYRTNHLPLPWSGSHESLNPTVPNPNIGQQNGNRAQSRKGHRNFAITDWPRKPKTYTYGNGEQEAGTAPAIRGLDGTTDGPPPAAVLATGLRSAYRRFHPVRMGRSRLALFPRAGLARHGSSLRRSGFLEPNGRELFEMSPAVGPEGGANGTLAGRTGVDEWAARRLRTGRPSDMV